MILVTRAPHETSPSGRMQRRFLAARRAWQARGSACARLVGNRLIGPGVDRLVDLGHGRASRLGIVCTEQAMRAHGRVVGYVTP